MQCQHDAENNTTLKAAAATFVVPPGHILKFSQELQNRDLWYHKQTWNFFAFSQANFYLFQDTLLRCFKIMSLKEKSSKTGYWFSLYTAKRNPMETIVLARNFLSFICKQLFYTCVLQ